MTELAASHDYHAVMMSFSAGVSDTDVWRALTRGTKGKETRAKTRDGLLRHGIFSTTTSYPRTTERVSQLTQNKRGEYEYDFYLGSREAHRDKHRFLAFPFRRMGKDLLTLIESELPASRPIKFAVPELKAIAHRLGRDKNLKIPIDVTGYAADVTADPLIDSIDLRGERPVVSTAFRDLESALGLNPRSCSLTYSHDDFPSIRLHLDRFGNQRFYLRASAENLVTVTVMLGHLLDSGLMSFRFSKPFERSLLNEVSD